MYWVYAIECHTPNHYYVGQTNNLHLRLMQHTRGARGEWGSGHPFTQEHGFKDIYGTWEVDTRAEALELETTIALFILWGMPDSVVRSDKVGH